MASSCLVLLLLKQLLLLLFVLVLALPRPAACYTSIFSFGDSYADTGNYYYSYEAIQYHCFRPPNGETYFGQPNGRCSNGRLIIDFIAESLGLPLLKPYLGIKTGKLENRNIEQGVNFAVVGATALDSSFFEQRKIQIFTHLSLNVQLEWFKELLPAICNSSSSCKSVLAKSLFLVGEIGGNDILYSFHSGKSKEEIKTYVPLIVNSTTSAISELIDLGAVTFLVAGDVPTGCMPSYLTSFGTPYEEEYDEAGCLKWLNNFSNCRNQQLQAALDQLRILHPHINIIYADYFNATQGFYRAPERFGFSGSTLTACCGSGGPYNVNSSAMCGDGGTRACNDPSKYISWDGIHMTETSYRWIAKGILDGSYTKPKIDISCLPNKLSAKKYQQLTMEI